ncbi:MAG: SBBP repeat-containing protein [Candidatus Thorarchaeota archaeon]
MDPLGNVYVVGETKSFGVGRNDIYLVKFNSSGMKWNYTWGCVMDDHGTEIIFTPSGDLFVAGYYERPPNCYILPGVGANSDLGLIKFNSEGIYQWNNTWKDWHLDYSSGMAIDSSENIYVAGSYLIDGLGDYDWCLVRFNSSGLADWYCTWGTSEGDFCRGLTLGPSRTAYATGYTIGYGAGGADICLVQFFLDQCPFPKISDEKLISGYDPIFLFAIAFTVSIFLIKRKK